MATIKKTADGKGDKRTKEYKEMVARMAKARKAAAAIPIATRAITAHIHAGIFFLEGASGVQPLRYSRRKPPF